MAIKHDSCLPLQTNIVWLTKTKLELSNIKEQCSGGSLLGGLEMAIWLSAPAAGEMRPMGVSIVLRLAEDAVCQDGRAGGEEVLELVVR